MGADNAFLINIEDDVEDGDQYTTAKILQTFFQDRSFDLILAGNVAIDEASGQVGPRLADLLDITYITTITKLDISRQTAHLEKKSEEHTSELQSRGYIVCRLLLD